MVNINEEIFISRKRKPCEQIFQRLMVTYNGRVGMCCHDWGAQHGVGFVDKESFEKDQKEFLSIKEKIDKNKKGFELLKEAKIPKNYNEPKHKVESLKDNSDQSEINLIKEEIINQEKEKKLKMFSNMHFSNLERSIQIKFL